MGIAGAILLRSGQAGKVGGWAALPARTHPALKCSRGWWGGALDVSESWELQVWAAAGPTCLVEERLGPPGIAIPALGWLLEEPALSGMRWTEGNAARSCARQPWPIPGSLRRPRPCLRQLVLLSRNPHADGAERSSMSGQDLNAGILGGLGVASDPTKYYV